METKPKGTDKEYLFQNNEWYIWYDDFNTKQINLIMPPEYYYYKVYLVECLQPEIKKSVTTWKYFTIDYRKGKFGEIIDAGESIDTIIRFFQRHFKIFLS